MGGCQSGGGVSCCVDGGAAGELGGAESRHGVDVPLEVTHAACSADVAAAAVGVSALGWATHSGTEQLQAAAGSEGG